MISATGSVGQAGTITITPIPAGGTIDAGSGKFIVDVPGIVTLVPSGDTACAVDAVGIGVANISWQATSNGIAISGDNVIQATIAAPPPPQATAGHVAFSGFA